MNIGLSREAAVFPVEVLKAYNRNEKATLILISTLHGGYRLNSGHSSFTSAK
jgi:hypothetical protein